MWTNSFFWQVKLFHLYQNSKSFKYIVQQRPQWVGWSLPWLSPFLRSRRTSKSRTGGSNPTTASTFASSTLLLDSTTLRSVLKGTESHLSLCLLLPPQVNIKEPLDGQWGRQMENGSWTGVVAILIFPVSKKSLFGVVAILFSKLFAFVKLLSLGGNRGKKGGWPLDELGSDWRKGESGRLLCGVHRLVDWLVQGLVGWFVSWFVVY